MGSKQRGCLLSRRLARVYSRERMDGIFWAQRVRSVSFGSRARVPERGPAVKSTTQHKSRRKRKGNEKEKKKTRKKRKKKERTKEEKKRKTPSPVEHC